MPKKPPPPWKKLIDRFLESVPPFKDWKSLAQSTVLTSTSSVVGSDGGGGQLIQLMERYIQQSQLITDLAESKARELVFLASCAVLANTEVLRNSRKVDRLVRDEVDGLVRLWYHYPSLVAKTVWDRYNGIKWIGEACSALYPYWGRKCHDMFVLCESSDFLA